MTYKRKETDVPTILPDDAWALTTGDNGLELFMPMLEPDDEVPNDAAFLVAVLTRNEKDAQWREELMEWFANRKPSE